MRKTISAVLIACITSHSVSLLGQTAADQFHKVKLMINTGDKSAAPDVIMRLETDRLVIRSKAGGADLKSFPYTAIKSAEYSYSKSPRWKSGAVAAVAVGVFALDCKRRERGKRCRDPKHVLCPAMQTSKFKEAEPRKGFFEAAQFLRVIAALPPDHADMARFLYVSGWRRGEAQGLQWTDVDLAAEMIRLPAERSKNGKHRLLPIGPKLKAVIDRRLALRDERQSEYVFSYVAEKRHKGNVLPLRDWRKRWERATREAGCEGALMHDFRRTAARNLIRAGLSEKEAMERTGHVTRSMFDRYHIVDETRMRQVAERFEEGLDLGLKKGAA